MSKKLDDLTPRLRDKAIIVIARMAEAGIPVFIVDTLRTPAEHAMNLAKGTSWIKQSKHLPDFFGMSHAIDLAPYEEYRLHGTDKLSWVAGPAWDVIGTLGKAQGLIWGGDWHQRDLGHLELP